MFSRDGSEILTAMPQELPPIDFLRAFARAAETLSFKDAAAQLHLSPSAVSRQIQSLEAHLGARCFAG
jgi:LysR family glycine cleavage system transcriptional activator